MLNAIDWKQYTDDHDDYAHVPAPTDKEAAALSVPRSLQHITLSLLLKSRARYSRLSHGDFITLDNTCVMFPVAADFNECELLNLRNKNNY